MRIKIIYIITFFLCTLPAWSQNKITLVQRINEIKSQNDTYYWDQYTHPNPDTAKVNATKRLIISINFDRSGKVPLSMEDVTPHVKYINIDRGNMKQFFVYIKKTDASTINGGEDPVTMPIAKAFVPDAFVQTIMEIKDFLNTVKYLKSLKAQGQILQYGKLTDVEDFSSLDLILFDIQSQQFITMLSPITESGMRRNLVNGSEDSLDNYPTEMTAAIWYIKK